MNALSRYLKYFTASSMAFVLLEILGTMRSKVNAAGTIQFSVRNPHGPQGTGNFKRKKDRHQAAGAEHEKKKKPSKWLKLRK